eukprot:2734263-Prymnesium_polylepis.1
MYTPTVVRSVRAVAQGQAHVRPFLFPEHEVAFAERSQDLRGMELTLQGLEVDIGVLDKQKVERRAGLGDRQTHEEGAQLGAPLPTPPTSHPHVEVQATLGVHPQEQENGQAADGDPALHMHL